MASENDFVFPTGLAAFVLQVSQATGLSAATVAAWVHAENGPATDPLGIKTPGTTQLENFGNQQAAATATVNLLRTPAYSSVLDTAKSTSDPKQQLAAIANSPWDTGKVGPKPAYLSLLLGSLKVVQPASSTSSGGGVLGGVGSALSAAATGDPVGAAGDLLHAAGVPVPGAGILDPVGEATKWVSGVAATGLAYFVLTVLGLVFVVVGALDAFGYSPARVAGGLRPKPTEVIPF